MPKYIFKELFVPVEVKEYVPTKNINKKTIELTKDYLLYKCYNNFKTFFNFKIVGGIKDNSIKDFKYIRVYTPRNIKKNDYFLINKDILFENSYVFNAYNKKIVYISEIAEMA